MKLLSILTLGAIAFALPAGAIAAPKPKAAAEAAVDGAKKAAEKPAAAAAEGVKKATGAKSLPMNSRADVIDTKAKTFTMTRKDGVAVKHVLTADTEIKNGEAAATLADIKVGDYVAGLRTKVSETEYTVVKITKFGPKAPKTEGEAKPAEGAKPEKKKKE